MLLWCFPLSSDHVSATELLFPVSVLLPECVPAIGRRLLATEAEAEPESEPESEADQGFERLVRDFGGG